MTSLLRALGRLGDLLLGGPTPVPVAARLDPFVSPHSRLEALTTPSRSQRLTGPVAPVAGPVRFPRCTSP